MAYCCQIRKELYFCSDYLKIHRLPFIVLRLTLYRFRSKPLRRTLRSEATFGNWRPFKNNEDISFSRYLKFLSWLFGLGNEIWSVNKIWHEKHFPWKNTKNVVEKLEHIEHISFIFMSRINWAFLFIVCQIEDFRNTLKLSCRPLGFTPYLQAPLKNKKEV